MSPARELNRLLEAPSAMAVPFPLSTAFLLPYCRQPGPRQGRNMRQCVTKRELFPRHLLWRVTRVRNADGTKTVVFGGGNGRSAYVSKDLASVNESVQRKRLARALKHGLPGEVKKELVDKAIEWERMSGEERGLLFGEVFGEDSVLAAVEEVQMGVGTGEELLLY
ncbi:unnamed protein product [Chondrus crispus]|uniref:YlxR domain-containing protein n=1 Tax=Chondrus crispus TaxID=2769 RepID=R7QQD2_CHOCR|nr:unnamed protein product [Chondrus crispus]CDF39580.1 unnamed protein product [Chondrus crispus]|eukprot:XP_005709874.1 unnamed protein product [Chondrus crispus]